MNINIYKLSNATLTKRFYQNWISTDVIVDMSIEDWLTFK